jgi:hypothetical protein
VKRRGVSNSSSTRDEVSVQPVNAAKLARVQRGDLLTMFWRPHGNGCLVLPAVADVNSNENKGAEA